MNILVFSWRDPKHPLAGGAEQVMHEHMKGWIKAGHMVTLFSSHYKGAPRYENLDGVRVIRRGFQIIGVHVLGVLYYLFGNHEKFDLVIDQFHGVPFFTPLYVREPKLAVLQEVAREIWLINPLPKPLNWCVGLVGYLAEPLFFLFYDKVPFMVGSQSAKNDLINMGISAKNIHIIPHGVITVLSLRGFPKEKLYTVMFLGALTKDKGIEDAIRTFAILNKKSRFNFWVVGRGSLEYSKFLRSLAKQEGIEKSIHFFGFVSEKKKFELLKRAHVLINPSIREGWGLVNIEANAMGTPVVSYKSAGLIDSVKERYSGLFCKSNTPNSLAKTVFETLKNRVVYQMLCKTSKAWASRFSWERSRLLSLRLLDDIVTSKQGA